MSHQFYMIRDTSRLRSVPFECECCSHVGTLTRDFKHTALDFSIIDEEKENVEEDEDGNVTKVYMTNVASKCILGHGDLVGKRFHDCPVWLACSGHLVGSDGLQSGLPADRIVPSF